VKFNIYIRSKWVSRGLHFGEERRGGRGICIKRRGSGSSLEGTLPPSCSVKVLGEGEEEQVF